MNNYLVSYDRECWESVSVCLHWRSAGRQLSGERRKKAGETQLGSTGTQQHQPGPPPEVTCPHHNRYLYLCI